MALSALSFGFVHNLIYEQKVFLTQEEVISELVEKDVFMVSVSYNQSIFPFSIAFAFHSFFLSSSYSFYVVVSFS